MRTTRIAPALVLALAAAAPHALGAQGVRVTFEPRFGMLPAAALWSRTTESMTTSLDPTDVTMPSRAVSTQSFGIRRDAMPLLGASVAIALAGRWRYVFDGAYASGDLRTRVTGADHLYMAAGGDPVAGGSSTQRERHPVSIAQFGLRAERAAVARGAAIDASIGAVAQRLRTRTTRWVPGPPSQGFELVPVHHRTSYLDPGLAIGIAVGPSTGPLAALRLGLRSTHVWRGPDLANAYQIRTEDALDAEGRRWQWQPEVLLGWRLGA